MSWRRDDDWGWDRYPASKPLAAKGGIKAQSKTGDFGKSWWAKRWISVLEGFEIGARLGRGKAYARKGQVLAVEIGKGRALAKVQGSRPQPYNITIEVKTIPTAGWRKVIAALSRQALFAAKLLAGEMPQDIETVFKEVGLSLFPEKHIDLTTDCSCPDSSNPCKHIAAVYYLLGEEFDRDPFLIFTLRGMTRDELLEKLGHAQSSAGAADASPATVAAAPEPLNPDVAAFWTGGLKDDPLGTVETPPVAAALPKRLGGFPFWRGAEPFLQALGPIYAGASSRGLDAFLGQVTGEATPTGTTPAKPASASTRPQKSTRGK